MLAYTPPTFAAAFIIRFGLTLLINFSVSSLINKFVSFLEDGITWVTFFDLDKISTKLEPTNPLEPKINIFILNQSTLVLFIGYM